MLQPIVVLQCTWALLLSCWCPKVKSKREAEFHSEVKGLFLTVLQIHCGTLTLAVTKILLVKSRLILCGQACLSHETALTPCF